MTSLYRSTQTKENVVPSVNPVPRRQHGGWIDELAASSSPPPHPEIRPRPAIRQKMLMSPSSGENSPSPIEALAREESGEATSSLDSFSTTHGTSSTSARVLRQTIKERTKSMVEKSKSAARRLSAAGSSSAVTDRPTTHSAADEQRNGAEQQQQKMAAEQTKLDAQIERSIQLGAKYVSSGQLSWERDQRQFGTEMVRPTTAALEQSAVVTTQSAIQPSIFAQMQLARPVPQSAEASAKFAAMICAPWQIGTIAPVGGVEAGRRTGKEAKWLDAEGNPRGTNAQKMLRIMTQNLHKPLFPDEEHVPPLSGQTLMPVRHHALQWRDPVPWWRWLELSETRRWLGTRPARLVLDVSRLEFDHHWLFTGREAKERELLRAYETFVGVHECALEAARVWLGAKQRSDECGGESADQEQEQPKSATTVTATELDVLFERILRVQKELGQSTAALQHVWESADQRQGQFVLKRVEGHPEMFEEEFEGGVPDELRAFFRSPLFVLAEREEQHQQQQQQQNVLGRGGELERARRLAVGQCRYQLQVHFNDVPVCVSEMPHALQWPSFSVPIARIFSLRVFEPPEQVRLTLAERFGTGSWQHVAHIFVPLPTIAADEMEQEEAQRRPRPNHEHVALQFASTLQRASHKASLGCGTRAGAPFMQGRLHCSLQWEPGTDQRQQRPPNSEQQTAGHHRPVARSATGRAQSPPTLFPRGTMLCTEEALANDVRLQALQKRWSAADGQGGRPQGAQARVPLLAREIEEREEAASAKVPWREGRKQQDSSELEVRRKSAREFTLALRQHLRESGEQRLRVRNLAELVREPPLPQVASLLDLLPALLLARPQESRRLKPTRLQHPMAQQRHMGLPQHHTIRNISGKRRLILNIQFASAVPERTNAEEASGPAHLFLLCSTKNQSVSTSTVDGRHANWQETLVLEVDAPDGRELGDDALELELFDRHTRPMEHDDREQDTRHEREERHWLGTAVLRLDTLEALGGKLDGHVALRGPVFHSGYRSASSDGTPCTVRLLLSMDQQQPPPVPISAVALGYLNGIDANLLAEAVKFEQRLRQRFSARRIVATVCDARGHRLLATRFLRPIVPPQHVALLFATQPKRAVAMAAQIVACIPALHELDCCAPPVWNTADEILRIGCASPDELGVLLCCWLLGLQMHAVLVLGSSGPDGPNSAYVLVQFPHDNRMVHWLISPTQGLCWAPSDAGCPLLSVGCVLSANNVFANVQPGQHPAQLDFDLRKRAYWEPLFASARTPDPTPGPSSASVQPAQLFYAQMDEHQLVEMRTGLEREIRLKLDQARPFAIPHWNLLASRALREVLTDTWELLPDSTGAISRLLDVDARLAQLRATFHVSALAFRVPFHSRAQIVRQTLRTQMHTNSEPQLQLALAVHLQPLLGDVALSCSVAICTLLPHRR